MRMKLKNPPFAALTLLSLCMMISSCKDDFETAEPGITAISPERGAVGATVTITGHHFSETPIENEVRFNGTAAVVTSSSHSQIVTTVPAGATTGKITVTVNGTTLTSSNDFEIFEPAAITSLSRSNGVAGMAIIISGTNFSATASGNVVKFGGDAVANIIEATATELVVEVPEAAITGKVSVTVNGVTVSSANTFTILAPTITNIDPTLGGEGLSVVIKGTNFSTNEDYNKVKFNNVPATVTAAASDQITVTVPEGASTGKITIQVGPNTVTSIADFTVCNNAELTIISPKATLSGNSINYEFTLINYGKETIDLSQWSYQNYASIDQGYDAGDAGGGGSILDSYGTLATGESVVISSSVGLGSSPSIYNYFIFTVNVKGGQTVNECFTTNNTVSVEIQK